MRLVNVNTLKLEEFHHKIPPYAILSHTWGDEEVTLEMYREYLDVTNRCRCPGADARNSKIEKKIGFAKIMGACRRAHADGLGYLWCDTNCIDKDSSAELSEAINSMYAWYRDSVVCYAYLGDVGDRAGKVTDEFRMSRWFTRGWTLQELLAPEKLVFFNKHWVPISDRQKSAELICGVTRIHVGVLKNRSTIAKYSVAQRMSWAADRQTARQEDIAYCLLGIFDINMPLLYGEGSRAFMRLQEEIIKTSDDQSIFAWDFFDGQECTVGILALSPNGFASCGSIARDMTITPEPYTVTNVGISLKLPMIRTCLAERVLVRLNCSVELQECRSCSDARPHWHSPVWIWLTSIGDGIYTRSPNPASRTSLTVLYPEKAGYATVELFGITSSSRVQSWVPGLLLSCPSNPVESTGFHITISFGRIRPRTGTFEAAFRPGNFILFRIPARGFPTLSHEIVSAGSYIVLLSIVWDHQGQPKHWRHATFMSMNQATLAVMSANNWDVLLDKQLGSRIQKYTDAGRIEYIHEQIRKLSNQPITPQDKSTMPFIDMENSLWQDRHGQLKVVVHLTFQETTRP